MSDHLTPTITDRGFRHLPVLVTGSGDRVRVYESSAADGPHLWLHATERGDAGIAACVHLDAEAAWELHEQLAHLLGHHYQGDARPPRARVSSPEDTQP
ncbi:MAG TPA: hypothetical protein VK045_04135 [Ornithinicoccus sp.]|nr:hypothetical protein [Ornithinicoccus sp.]